MALFIIPDFLTPNIHYSFSFKPRYSLFIIQLPPPRINDTIMQYGTVIYKNSLTGISHWKDAHMKYNFIHNYDLFDI